MTEKQTFLKKLEAAYGRVFRKIYDNRHKPVTPQITKCITALNSLPIMIDLAKKNLNNSIVSYWELVTESGGTFEAKTLQILKQSVINYYAESNDLWEGAEYISNHVGNCEFRSVDINIINDEINKSIDQAKIDIQSNIEELKDLESEYKQSIL